MSITDYLIDQNDHDWDALLGEWGFLLPGSFTLWMVNLLGDLIIVKDDDKVCFVDIGNGTCEVIARNREEFTRIVDEEGNANNWFAIPLIEKCKSRKLYLSNRECYGFKVPPILGGDYEPENLEPRILSSHYHFLAHIHKQIMDLPDGTKVSINFNDDA